MFCIFDVWCVWCDMCFMHYIGSPCGNFVCVVYGMCKSAVGSVCGDEVQGIGVHCTIYFWVWSLG